MSPLDRARLLDKIVNDYQQQAPSNRPLYVWVREYDSVESHQPPQGFPTLSWANRVWVLSEIGLQERSIWDWRRFEVIHQDFHSPSNPIWNGRVHEIGSAAFGICKERSVFYLEMIFGGRWGSGWMMKMDSAGVPHWEMMWVS